MAGLSVFNLLVHLTVLIDFLLCDSKPDQCEGMSKTRRKMMCGDKIQQDEKMYEAKNKQFQSKAASDMVQEHYVDLPYPPFSMGDMTREMAYYTHSKWDALRPMFMQYANNLDMLNHHLYQVDYLLY